MLSNLYRPFLACAAMAFAMVGGQVHAESWWSRTFSSKPSGFRIAQDLEKATTVSIGEFTGATG
ncbi:MAG: hypothetical protein JWO08_1749, partial [Verrucomicrobiaceae bacterium]|nr:hypothetical protein [Verrucomicrobiaceae bacterium]